MPGGSSEAEKQAVSNTARAADGKYYGVASIGNNEHTRQLVGIAAGSLDTDAANVSQLKKENAQNKETLRELRKASHKK